MNVDEFFLELEHALRHALPSISEIRVRPLNNSIYLSLGSVTEFLITVRSATGANILLETGWAFDGSADRINSIKNCYLRLSLTNNCVDGRLIAFIREIITLSSASGMLGDNIRIQLRDRTSELASFLSAALEADGSFN